MYNNELKNLDYILFNKIHIIQTKTCLSQFITAHEKGLCRARYYVRALSQERTCIYANIKRYDIRRHKSNDIRHELKYQLFYIAGPIAVHTNIFEYYYLFFQHMLWEGNTMRWDCQSFSSDENMFITMEPFWNLDTSMLFYPWFITLYFLYYVDIAQLQGKMQYFVCPMIAIW